MTTKQPPTPPASRSPKGGSGRDPGSAGKITRDDAARANRTDNTEEQGAAGNIAQNTHNQGHQQDR